MKTIDTAAFNNIWASLILDELVRLGVSQVCLAPGSRSTPLTLAAAQHQGLTCHSHFDERGLGFLALGLAKGSKAPVAIITTSGTAVANLYPAIVEAFQSGHCLVVLSGDRPPELIDCGANQAIDQQGIFADYAHKLELPPANSEQPAASLLTQIDRKLASAMSHPIKPLHINCQFREPFYPNVEQLAQRLSPELHPWLAPLEDHLSGVAPYSQYPSAQHTRPPSKAQLSEFGAGKGVIVVGELDASEKPESLVALAKRLGWPLLADAQSQLRQHPVAIANADMLLHSQPAQDLLGEAEHLLLVGGRLVSKRIQSLIGSHQWRSVWQTLPGPARLEPSHIAKHIWYLTPSQLAALPWSAASAHSGWADSLNDWSEQLEQHWQRQIDQGEFGEAQVVRSIAAQQWDHQDLFIGNSLPIRLFDQFAPLNDKTQALFTNRGASGIDGLLASACGIQRARKQPMTLIIGDVSQLHDLNSLALAKDAQAPLVIVIVNNDGGSIFNLLPVPSAELRERYYRLGHGLSFESAAAMFELPYQKCQDIESFNEGYQVALTGDSSCIIEVVVDSQQASDQIKTLAQQLQQGE
ncbi:2-succinyl-5-enolpyruvyl-6-hydroxy-3-cyclohexene-1-carboxylic-acid synthase [Paraferrimonas sedimenticola]|uniref:2-succinyl-5-enolpyruvyl-6-hydroxy-3-cyclohexene-1-carboxylate synthase n=1 Tax=Paraferrimonas sedimenticola TaxID=375674 RepID=A0AA37VZV5_9GAMM|nr:2-succinyl-5-enolpyruvyl-6-hydroxy-3-cyclohexene-1-carboxylic-acid synthase [Paraferrimonas sedimenticola]GLP97826.1 2-succinyl-5-enolpyruvyl-6-hydroxy-3-cyclohexene- 1-carboxylate synthase [Paraferrimonas sedimenticola]